MGTKSKAFSRPNTRVTLNPRVRGVFHGFLIALSMEARRRPLSRTPPLRLSTRSPGLSAYRLHTTFRLLPLLQSCFTSTETVEAIRDGSPVPLLLHTAAELWVLHQLVPCCFASTETLGTIRDGEPRTATSAFTQLLSSSASVG